MGVRPCDRMRHCGDYCFASLLLEARGAAFPADLPEREAKGGSKPVAARERAHRTVRRSNADGVPPAPGPPIGRGPWSAHGIKSMILRKAFSRPAERSIMYHIYDSGVPYVAINSQPKPPLCSDQAAHSRRHPPGGAGNRAKSSRRSSILQNVSASRSEQFAAPWADLRTRASSAGEKVRARS